MLQRDVEQNDNEQGDIEHDHGEHYLLAEVVFGDTPDVEIGTAATTSANADAVLGGLPPSTDERDRHGAIRPDRNSAMRGLPLDFPSSMNVPSIDELDLLGDSA
jgi:hypothetical protein